MTLRLLCVYKSFLLIFPTLIFILVSAANAMCEPSAPLKSLTSSETNISPPPVTLVSEIASGQREEDGVTMNRQTPLLSSSKTSEPDVEPVTKISLNNNFDEPEDMEASDSNDSHSSHECIRQIASIVGDQKPSTHLRRRPTPSTSHLPIDIVRRALRPFCERSSVSAEWLVDELPPPA